MFNLHHVRNRSHRKNLGPILVLVLPLLNAGVWMAFPPTDDGSRPAFFRQYMGELIGSTMMVLMAFSLLLATRWRILEPLFGGLDKMYSVHRKAGVASFLLLLLHFIVTPLNPGQMPPGRAPGYIAFSGFVILIVLTLLRVSLRFGSSCVSATDVGGSRTSLSGFSSSRDLPT